MNKVKKGNVKNMETENNNIEDKKNNPKEVYQSLQVQRAEHQRLSEHHGTMAVKAQGAMEVLLQMHPELQENNK